MATPVPGFSEPRSGPWPHHGFLTVTPTLLGLAVLLAAVANLWPRTPLVPVIGYAAFPLIMLGLALWLISTIVVVQGYRQFRWWMVGVPLLVVAGSVASFVVYPTFDSTRGAMERTAHEVLEADPPTPLLNHRVGRMDFDSIGRWKAEAVKFAQWQEFPSGDEKGWIYSPTSAPRSMTGLPSGMQIKEIGDGWYSYDIPRN